MTGKIRYYRGKVIEMKRFSFTVFSALIMSGILLFTQKLAAADDLFQITLINVGKGDCILIQTGTKDDPMTVMIDTGYKETAKDVLAYLKAHNVQKLDALVISHFHKDHVGGGAAILKGIPVGRVYMPDYEGTRKVYEEMMAVLTASDSTIPYERLKENKSFSLGGAEYRLYPSKIEFDGNNDNDVSMAACLEYNGHTALFAGDLENDGIKQLFENNQIPENHFDILKLPHHGAQEENTDQLLKRLKPGGITVITDGQNRRAHGVLFDELQNDGFEVYCSADAGTIKITAEDAGYTVEKSKNPDYKTSGDWKYLLADDGSAVLAGYTGTGTEITLPSEIDGKPVKSIADSAFYNHKELKSVTIPEGIESIGNSAFSWCTSLRNITIPGSVTAIGNAAFSWCTSLNDVTLPDSVKSIGESGFERCTALNNITLSKGLTAIAPSLFERCGNLESIAVPAGVKTIGKDAFKRCAKLTDVSLPESVTLIDEGAFKSCESLESIDIPAGVKTIEESAFEWCTALKSIQIPDSVTSLGKSAFFNCTGLESAEIGKGVKTIKKSTFSGCTALKIVTIPDSVESIKADAFRNCTNLKEIRYGGTTAQWEALKKDKDWNAGTPDDLIIHCSDSDPDPEPDPDPAPVPNHHPGISFFSMPELPGTGFSTNHPEPLRDLPEDLHYDPSGLTLQIPMLDVSETIVTVPFRNGEYPVEWLGSNIGLPEEFTLPGSGASVLVAHNHLNTAEAGPFALLATLPEDAKLFITDGRGNLISFSVFANVKIAADDMTAAESLSSACENSLLLITCEDEKPEGGYASRRIIAAKPVFSVGG